MRSSSSPARASSSKTSTGPTIDGPASDHGRWRVNIHEHQAKALLKSFGLPIADGVAIFSAKDAETAAKSLPGPLYVVKSQIHAGGRGKGRFKELGPDAKGGVRLAKSPAEVVSNAT